MKYLIFALKVKVTMSRMNLILLTVVSEHLQVSEVYSESVQTYKMELFAEMINSFQLLTVFAKSSLLDVWMALMSFRCGCSHLSNQYYIIYMVYLYSKTLPIPKPRISSLWFLTYYQLLKLFKQYIFQSLILDEVSGTSPLVFNFDLFKSSRLKLVLKNSCS